MNQQIPNENGNGRHKAVTIAPARLPYHPALEERFGVGQAEWRALVDAIFPLAKEAESIILALSYCRARKLDPFKRVVHIVPMWNAALGRMVETVWPGIGELRTTAFRTRQYAGRDNAEFGPTLTRQIGTATLEYPEWCQITCYRVLGGQKFPFPGPRVYWMECYATTKKDDPTPNSMWRKRPFGQLDKCFDVETEILTDRGFQRFAAVTGRIMQVCADGTLRSTTARPFSRDYDGSMISLHSRDLDFVVTPNHDMVTTAGKIEAAAIYELAQTKPKFFAMRCAQGSSVDIPISDKDIKLSAAFLADGWDGHGGKISFKVSRPAKRSMLMALGPISVQALDNGGVIARAANGRTIQTIMPQTLYTFDASSVAKVCSIKKLVDCDFVSGFSKRQARLFVTTWLDCDGSKNKKTGVRRLYTSRPDHAAAFEMAAVLAGLSVSNRKSRTSDIGTKPNFSITVSERSEIGIIRWGKDHGRSKGNKAGRTGLELEPNDSGKVWCVTVPSGIIVVRRHGFSMLCGNCAEAAALRAAFPEEIGNDYTNDEMEGKTLGVEALKSAAAIAPHRTLDAKLDAIAAAGNGDPPHDPETGEITIEGIETGGKVWTADEVRRNHEARIAALNNPPHDPETGEVDDSVAKEAQEAERRHQEAIAAKLEERAAALEDANPGSPNVDPQLQALLDAGRAAATNGTAKYRKWENNIPVPMFAQIKPHLDALRKVAGAADGAPQ